MDHETSVSTPDVTEVEVVDLTERFVGVEPDAQMLALTDTVGTWPVDLGADGSHFGQMLLEVQVNDMLGALRQRARYVYAVRWQGGRTPRGVVIPTIDKQISYLQHGLISVQLDPSVPSWESAHDTAGTYLRLIDCGGPERRHQAVLLFIY